MSFLDSLLESIQWSVFSIPKIQITDIIDIISVSFILYQIILWIKETRAWTLFKGIIIVIIIAALAYIFNLYTISLIVARTFDVGILAIIILFQPELRTALQQLGNGRLNMSLVFGSEKQTELLSQESGLELIHAIKKLACDRVGALIVIQQEVALGDLEQTGLQIDSKITSQLLLNIFEDKTPLHDGAVIIKHDRIAAATCILPLTQTEIGREFGTRHRAAVGVSEVSDAIIITVSEETGGISLAKNGKLIRHITEKELRDVLLTEKASKKGIFIRKGR